MTKVGTNLNQEDYERLQHSAERELTEDEAKARINKEFGFEFSQIRIVCKVDTWELDETGYIVYGEDSQDTPLYADGRLCTQVLQGTIDYYTRDGEDVMADEIQKALNDAGISFWLNSVQYEDETNLVHFEWVWEVGNDQV